MSLWWFTIVSLTWPFNISQTGLLGIDDSPFFYHSSEVEMCSLLVNVGETMSYSNHVNWWFISPTLFCENIPSCFPDIDVHDRFLFQSWLSHRHQPSGLRCSRCAGPRLGRTGTAWSHVAATAWLQRCCVFAAWGPTEILSEHDLTIKNCKTWPKNANMIMAFH